MRRERRSSWGGEEADKVAPPVGEREGEGGGVAGWASAQEEKGGAGEGWA